MFKKIVWVFFEKGVSTLIQFFSLIVLGRLLSPEDYGIYGVMIIFISLSDTLVDSGFGGAFVNKKNISRFDINTLFFSNALASIVLYLVIFSLAPLLEHVYKIENLSLYFRVLGLVVITHAISIVQNAIILRKLRFKYSAKINLISNFLSTVVAIFVAYAGLGVWALICQVLLNSLIMSVMLWAKSNVRIGFELSKKSFVNYWQFGSNLLGANILQSIVNNVCNSIIPQIGTIQLSGLYFQATKLNNVPVSLLGAIIDKSTFPILSRETNTANLLLRARSINRYFLFFITPIFPLLSLVSSPLIQIILGKKWIETSDYFSVIIWSGIALLWQVLSRNILKSLGLTSCILKIEFAKSFVILTAILISIEFGVYFLVVSVTIASFICSLVWSLSLKAKLGYLLKDQLSDIAHPVIISIIIFIILRICIHHVPYHIQLFLLPIGYSLYLILVALLGGEESNNIIRFLRKK